MPELLTVFEVIAVLTGIICVALQTKEIIWAWPFGIVSVSISVFIFYQSQLYSDVILHLVYIFLNIYGWHYWFQKRKSPSEDAPIQYLNNFKFLIWSIGILVGTSIWGYGMNKWTGADLAYLDAFTTVGSLAAQLLLARKVLQNWIIWIIVDIVAVNVYIYKEIYFIAFLFFIYLLLAVYGYFDWKKEFKSESRIS